MSELPTRVVFVDVDGVVIPSTFVLVDRDACWERRFPAHTIAVLNELCSRSGARIVTNTTHNQPRTDVPDIADALVAAGLDPAHLHPTDSLTLYPDMGRDDAVREWLGRHPEITDWVAYDDAAFTQDDQLIWVDPDSGLTTCHLNQALERFGCRPIMILM
jgi:hypothetical protein